MGIEVLAVISGGHLIAATYWCECQDCIDVLESLGKYLYPCSSSEGIQQQSDFPLWIVGIVI